MNSSANQTSPVSRQRDVPSRVTDFLLTGRSPKVPQNATWKSVREIASRTAASKPEYAFNGKVYARSNAQHAALAPTPPAPPLVELRKMRNWPVRRNF
jgi:hypothetical protein